MLTAGARFREIQPEYQCVNGDTPNPLIWGSGPLTAEQRVRYAYLRQMETERAAAALLLYPGG